MTPFWVVAVLDVVTDRVVRFGPGLESAAMYEFFLQGGEEAFRNGVVPAISSSTHTAFSVVKLQHRRYAALAYWDPRSVMDEPEGPRHVSPYALVHSESGYFRVKAS